MMFHQQTLEISCENEWLAVIASLIYITAGMNEQD